MTRRKARITQPRRNIAPSSSRKDLRIGLRVYGYLLLVLVMVAAIGAAVVWMRPLAVLSGITRVRLGLKGFHGEQVTLEGHRIHYFEGGRGAPVVLVHGLGGRAEDWANLMPQLSSAGYHVYAMDLLGYGRSDRPASASYSIAEEAEIVEAFLTKLQLDKVALGGWSMGGWVAGRVALDDPQRISKLMLFDAAGVEFTPGFDASDFTPGTPEGLQRLYALLMPHPERMPDFLVRDMLRRGRKTNWVTKRSVQSMFAGSDLLDARLRELKMPVLIVWGKDDHLLPPSMGIAMHQAIPQSALELFDGCGHLAPGQCADRIGPKVLEFLKGNGPAPGASLEVSQAR